MSPEGLAQTEGQLTELRSATVRYGREAFRRQDPAEACVEQRADGRRHPHSGSGARLVRGTCREACGVSPEVCGAPPRYVDSRAEILTQAADAAAHLLYQAIVPARSHLDMALPYDVTVLDRLCTVGVLEDAHYVTLPPEKEEATALEEERPRFVEPTRSQNADRLSPHYTQSSLNLQVPRPISLTKAQRINVNAAELEAEINRLMARLYFG